MKTLIVYYSRTGMTKKVGQKLASLLGADIEELIDTDSRAGAWGYIKSGREAMQKKLAFLETTKFSASDYDLVIVGTPTWAYAMSCPIRTYLSENKNKIKKIAFFATHGSDGGLKAIQQMAQLTELKPEAELVLTSKEAILDNYQDKLNLFIERVK